MADRVVRIRLEHRRHIALLKHPYAIVGEHLVNLAHEGDRVFQVVEHRKRRDYPRFLSWKALTQQCSRKEIRNQLDVCREVAAELDPRRVNAHKNWTSRVSLQSGAVVATDIHHKIACNQLYQFEDSLHFTV